MDIKLDLSKLPPYVRIGIPFAVSVVLILLFVFLVYSPKDKEINFLNTKVAKLDNEIASGEVKARKLDVLKAENAILKSKLVELQEQLPEGKEVSILLKQISDLGLASGLEILLWKPGARRISSDRLYAEIPVQVEVITGYHNLGTFFSHISRLKRIVNISGIEIKVKASRKGGEGELTNSKFTAVTFGALTPEEMAPIGE